MKKFKFAKLIFLTFSYLMYLVLMLTKSFKLITASKKVILVSVFDTLFSEYFPSVQALNYVCIAISGIIFVMLFVCVVGEVCDFTHKEKSKFVKKMGYKLESKDIKLFALVLIGIIGVNFVLSKGTEAGTVQLSCLTYPFLVLGIIVAINLILIMIPEQKKPKKKEYDVL